MSQPSAQAPRPCACGHERAAHEHYRAGTECALCGPEVCPRYRPRGAPRRLLDGPVGLLGALLRRRRGDL